MMNTIGGQIRSQNLLKIKKIVDQDNNGDKFIIARRDKNIEFMREYGLNHEDIKDIIRGLTVEDFFQDQKKIEIQNTMVGYLNLIQCLKIRSYILK